MQEKIRYLAVSWACKALQVLPTGKRKNTGARFRKPPVFETWILSFYSKRTTASQATGCQAPPLTANLQSHRFHNIRYSRSAVTSWIINTNQGKANVMCKWEPFQRKVAAITFFIRWPTTEEIILKIKCWISTEVCKQYLQNCLYEYMQRKY